jgi:hypothetical protein
LFALKAKAPKLLKSHEISWESVLPVSRGVPLISNGVAAHVPANVRINVSTKIARAIALNFFKFIKILH